MAKAGSKPSHSDWKKRLPALLKAVRVVQQDESFDPAIETSPEYLEAAQELARGGYRYVVFGHTHLAKRIPLDGGGAYLNSGITRSANRLIVCFTCSRE